MTGWQNHNCALLQKPDRNERGKPTGSEQSWKATGRGGLQSVLPVFLPMRRQLHRMTIVISNILSQSTISSLCFVFVIELWKRIKILRNLLYSFLVTTQRVLSFRPAGRDLADKIGISKFKISRHTASLLHALLYLLYNLHGCSECRYCKEQYICPYSRPDGRNDR